MYWQLRAVTAAPGGDEAAVPAEGRFVLHRHRDAAGPHLDLRLEQDGYLLGWRIDGADLAGEAWATEKAPHPMAWLEQDGDAVREDEGAYAWIQREGGEGELELRGREGVRRIHIAQAPGPGPACMRAVAGVLQEFGLDEAQVGQTLRDGLTARGRAIERFCGLGRELDGSAFDETVWRQTLAGLSLEEIHGHLRTYEVRFDQAHPPAPVSRPEPLEAHEHESAREKALRILKAG